MLKEVKGNVWDLLNYTSTVCILTNNTVLENGKNIMGAGIALEACKRNQGLEMICGKAISDHTYSLGYDSITGAEMLRFPTKDKVWDNSELKIIVESLIRLREYCVCNTNKKVYLPRPGCGCGGLDWEEEVKPLCEHYLNDLENVIIISF